LASGGESNSAAHGGEKDLRLDRGSIVYYLRPHCLLSVDETSALPEEAKGAFVGQPAIPNNSSRSGHHLLMSVVVTLTMFPSQKGVDASAAGQHSQECHMTR
jgi:hypothetical protein